MSSTDPDSFTGLLSSQQNWNPPGAPSFTPPSHPNPSSFPFTSQPFPFSSPFTSHSVQTPNLNSSEPVYFSSQTDTEDCVEVSLNEIEAEGGKGSRERWSVQEDVQLISAWLNTSKDPIVGNDQKVDSFWNRVTEYFQASLGGPAQTLRNPVKCKARWNRINKCVNKFVGNLSEATARRTSGQSDDDVMNVARELYKADNNGASFTLEHCWRALKNDQKWCLDKELEKKNKANKRGKLDADGAFSSSSNNDVSEVRPPGVKAAKKKGKNPVVEEVVEDTSVVKIDKLAAMKAKEAEDRKFYAKMKLIDTLSAQTALTPAQIMLRDKLVEEMLADHNA